ncbi:MAG: bifunctional methionine sulfoxide reductase B/A protein [candidate division Zixibacteria bacterium]
MADEIKNKKYNDLTPAETAVIIHKGTERPFSGELYDHWKAGTYVCKRCDAPLYKSEDKFDAHCGWPSFDDEIKGAVKHQTDADGRRTEILCANCDAHLGHLFLGEGFTDKNARHCVNSISMKFIPEEKPERYQKAYIAGGCFWGVEYYLQKTGGVISTTVGYIGGRTENPSYKEVCYENTGHAEAVEVVFDPSLVSYEDLAKLFFEIHDPTQIDRQGPDIGKQYRSAIFYTDEKQKQISEKLICILKDKGYKVATELTPVGTFWKAEDYHQDYYSNKKGQPYCHAYQKKF